MKEIIGQIYDISYRGKRVWKSICAFSGPGIVLYCGACFGAGAVALRRSFVTYLPCTWDISIYRLTLFTGTYRKSRGLICTEGELVLIVTVTWFDAHVLKKDG